MPDDGLICSAVFFINGDLVGPSLSINYKEIGG
jgi:hypothetical protein